MGFDAEPAPGAAVPSSATLVVVTPIRSLPGVLPFGKAQQRKELQRVSRVCLTLFPCPSWGCEGAGLSLGGAGGAAGAARFASLTG